MTQAYPDVGAIDATSFKAAILSVLDENSESLYAYSQPDGLPALKEAMAGLMAEAGVAKRSLHDIVITTGGQQALNLVTRALVRPGDVVLVERPSFFGALDLFRSINARMVGIDLHDDGPDIEQVEREVRDHRPKLMFLMPTFHNPTGVTTSLEKRRALLDVSRRYEVPILEDDHCPEIRFGGRPIPPIKALAEPDDLIFYVRGMGKAFVPGIRLGFVAAPASYVDALVTQKAIADLHTSPLLQEAFTNYLASPASRANLERIRTTYADIQSSVTKVLRSKLPDGCEFTQPDGGFSLWIRLPEGTDAVDLCWAAAQRGVGVLMGTPLFADNPDRSTIRLSYGLADKELLTEGVQRLCQAMHDLSVRRPRQSRVVI